jgi:hypothetical protein
LAPAAQPRRRRRTGRRPAQPCLRDEPAPPEPAASPAAPEGLRAQQARARHAAVHAALGRGLNLTQISATLHLDRTTVRRYASASDPGELLPDAPAARHSLLGPHPPYLQPGCSDVGGAEFDDLRERHNGAPPAAGRPGGAVPAGRACGPPAARCPPATGRPHRPEDGGPA